MQGVEPAPRPVNQQPPSVWAAGIALGIGIACAVAWRQLTGQNRSCHSFHPCNILSDHRHHTVFACKHAHSRYYGMAPQEADSLIAIANHIMQLLQHMLYSPKHLVVQQQEGCKAADRSADSSAYRLPHSPCQKLCTDQLKASVRKQHG